MIKELCDLNFKFFANLRLKCIKNKLILLTINSELINDFQKKDLKNLLLEHERDIKIIGRRIDIMNKKYEKYTEIPESDFRDLIYNIKCIKDVKMDNIERIFKQYGL